MNVAYEWHDVPPADFAVIGDPVAHSRSPQMHEAAYRALGLNLRYVAVRVSAGKVEDALDHFREFGFKGVNVTVPHKSEAMDWGDPDELAEKIGVANTIDLQSRIATNTDGPGFLDTLEPFAFPQGATALILGAGGSARAIAAVLPSAGFQVSIWNRTATRAIGLAQEFGLESVDKATARFDLVINATSVGLSKDRIAIDWRSAKPATVAYDLVYGKTPFLEEATAQGLRVVDGKELLVAQGARSFEFWLGIRPPRDVMLEAIQ
ncbi:MAG: shikimate dehydrogenase [Chlorobia bacterium]|nr:shikimate dehydrogenase [Fimbriimonadaceae bacterium]